MILLRRGRRTRRLVAGGGLLGVLDARSAMVATPAAAGAAQWSRTRPGALLRALVRLVLVARRRLGRRAVVPVAEDPHGDVGVARMVLLGRRAGVRRLLVVGVLLRGLDPGAGLIRR